MTNTSSISSDYGWMPDHTSAIQPTRSQEVNHLRFRAATGERRYLFTGTRARKWPIVLYIPLVSCASVRSWALWPDRERYTRLAFGFAKGPCSQQRI